MEIKARRLSSDLMEDYLEFFDNRAFAMGQNLKAAIVFGIIGRMN